MHESAGRQGPSGEQSEHEAQLQSVNERVLKLQEENIEKSNALVEAMKRLDKKKKKMRMLKERFTSEREEAQRHVLEVEQAH